jgi:hypothetical protein
VTLRNARIAREAGRLNQEFSEKRFAIQWPLWVQFRYILCPTFSYVHLLENIGVIGLFVETYLPMSITHFIAAGF